MFPSLLLELARISIKKEKFIDHDIQKFKSPWLEEILILNDSKSVCNYNRLEIFYEILVENTWIEVWCEEYLY